jgi:hypothetical protein
MAPTLEDLGAADERPEAQALLANLKASLPKLEKLLDECSDHWGYEDPIYRFYHQSFKVYALGHTTKRIVSALQELSPDRPLNEWFIRLAVRLRCSHFPKGQATGGLLVPSAIGRGAGG